MQHEELLLQLTGSHKLKIQSAMFILPIQSIHRNLESHLETVTLPQLPSLHVFNERGC